jgi:uncharacterized phiE125 gp8 family phage protein
MTDILTLITAPTSDPVTIEQARRWGRFGDSDDDTIAELIRQATAHLDGPRGILNPKRCLGRQIWELSSDAFPETLPLVPVTSIVSIKYTDEDGVEQTVPTEDYALIAGDEETEIVLVTDASWPTLGSGTGLVRVRFVAGYSSVPPQLVGDVLTFVQFWYDNREKRGQLPPGWTSRYRRPVYA